MKQGLNTKQQEKLDSWIWDYGYKRAMVEVHLTNIANTLSDTREERRYIDNEEAKSQEDARQAHALKDAIIEYVDGIVKFYMEAEEFYRGEFNKMSYKEQTAISEKELETALSEGQDLKS